MICQTGLFFAFLVSQLKIPFWLNEMTAIWKVHFRWCVLFHYHFFFISSSLHLIVLFSSSVHLCIQLFRFNSLLTFISLLIFILVFFIYFFIFTLHTSNFDFRLFEHPKSIPLTQNDHEAIEEKLGPYCIHWEIRYYPRAARRRFCYPIRTFTLNC